MNAIFVNGFVAALLAGMVTGVGGLLVFLKKRYYFLIIALFIKNY